MAEESLICSFCSKSRKDVTKMIVGASKTSICNECVKLCIEILDEDVVKTRKEKVASGDLEVLNPVNIKEHLDQYVVGQDEAKTVLSVAVANHYKRITNPPKDFELDKSNVLILGATGSGKTLLAKTIAGYLDVPFTIADATTLTESGYVGDDVENVIQKLYTNSGGNITKTEQGIIFIDEIDKITRKSENTSITRDVSGEGVQQGLLKIVEGTECRVPPHGGRKHPDAQTITINTKNILFIVGGAFTELEKQIENREAGGMGFGASIKEQNTKNYLSDVKPEDLIKYGLIPEFVGRFSMITHVNKLSEEQLIKILTEPKNAIIKQMQYLFGLDDIKIDFTKEAKISIAKKAKELGTNARGLKNIMDNILLPFQFDAVEMKTKGVETIKITEDVVDNSADPVLLFRKENGISKKQNGQ
jgi:ATP-dependent Clp protease ATP-binding subunit ClpX|tara:strand:+ start:207 stop:1460 length:1254 start_codon:yes stop_codon:yes gene_type:complete